MLGVYEPYKLISLTTLSLEAQLCRISIELLCALKYLSD